MGNSFTVEIDDLYHTPDARTNANIFQDQLAYFSLSENEWIYLEDELSLIEWQVDSDGLMDGVYKKFIVNTEGKKNLSVICFYASGLKEGVEMNYDEDREQTASMRYSKGIPIGPLETYEGNKTTINVPPKGYRRSFPLAKPNLFQFYSLSLLTLRHKQGNKWMMVKNDKGSKGELGSKMIEYQVNSAGQKDGMYKMFKFNPSTNTVIPKVTKFYKDGCLHGVKMTFAGGCVDHCSHWVDGVKDGRSEYYFPDGRLKDIKLYEKGALQIKGSSQLRVTMGLTE